MRTVAVYPGRFHPFSLGHKAVYDHLSKNPQIDQVVVATSEKQEPEKSPFSFADKTSMIAKTGIPSGNIIKVRSPYNITELQKTLQLDPQQDRLIFALGGDDAARLRLSDQGPLHPLTDFKSMLPVGDGQHAYVEVIPQISYNVLGKKITHASDIRKMYLNGNDNDRMQIITDLYGSPDPDLKAMFDQRLGVDQTQEAVIYGAEKVYAGEQPASIMREERLICLRENIQFLQQQIRKIRESQDYIDERRSRKK